MPTSASRYPRFSLPGSPPFNRWQLDRLFRNTSSSPPSVLWNALKFLALLPMALLMLVANLAMPLAMVVVTVLLIPIAILTPVLGIAALILIAGFFLQLLGVGS